MSGTQNSTPMTKLSIFIKTKLPPHKRENFYSKTTIPGSLQYEFHTPPHFQLARLNFLLNILSGDTLNYSETKSTKLNQTSPTYRANSKNYFHREIILNTFDPLFFFVFFYE